MTEEKLLTWFEAERAKAIDPPALGAFKLTATVSSPLAVPKTTVQGWREEVAGHPEHPLRYHLEVAERQLQYGPDRHEFTIWYGGPRRWRISKTMSYGGMDPSYLDAAREGESRWNIMPESMAIDNSQGRSQLDQYYTEIQTFISRILYGSTHYGRTENREKRRVQVKDDRWAIHSENDRGWSWVFEGRWDRALQRPVVLRMTEQRARDDEAWYTVDYGQWAQRGALAAWPMEVVTEHRLGNGIIQRTEISNIAMESIRRNEMDALLKSPRPSGSDVFRGEVTARQVNDMVRGQFVRFDESGIVDAVNDPSRSHKASSWLKTMAYVMAAAIVAMLILIRIRQYGRA